MSVNVTNMPTNVTIPRRSRENPEIRNFILRHIGRHPKDIASYAAAHFKTTRVTTNRYLSKLTRQGLLLASGETKAREYKLKTLEEHAAIIEISKDTEEHVVFREQIAPYIQKFPQNVIEIVEYCASEMINNVIDHSESNICKITTKINAGEIIIFIRDHGVGIFKKIQKECNLNDAREAILELAKGKLTTDPDRHTGEGIFFTSRMCLDFDILSGNLVYTHYMEDDDDYLFEREKERPDINGTLVLLTIDANAEFRVQDVFAKYESDVDGYRAFTRTHVPVRLALYGNEQLVSRSQARRVLARFNRFSEVCLDFKDVPRIGKAFADEIFRVYRKEHPEVRIIPFRYSQEVKEVIDRATGATNDGGHELSPS
jgi:anti-sigma regulatory factor (Ser/Thr protein kinase)